MRCMPCGTTAEHKCLAARLLTQIWRRTLRRGVRLARTGGGALLSAGKAREEMVVESKRDLSELKLGEHAGQSHGKEPFTDYTSSALSRRCPWSRTASSRGRAQSDPNVDTRRAPRSQSSRVRYSQQKAQHNIFPRHAPGAREAKESCRILAADCQRYHAMKGSNPRCEMLCEVALGHRGWHNRKPSSPILVNCRFHSIERKL